MDPTWKPLKHAALRAQCEAMALQLGRELILQRNDIHSITELLDLVRQLND